MKNVRKIRPLHYLDLPRDCVWMEIAMDLAAWHVLEYTAGLGVVIE